MDPGSVGGPTANTGLSLSCPRTVAKSWTNIICAGAADSVKDGPMVKRRLAYLEWYVKHATDWLTNDSSSASSMTATGVTELFGRSMEKYKVWYYPYIGDGDSSAFKTVCRAQPYGPDFELRKEESVGHVQKKMGTGLWRLLDKNKRKMLSYDKPLGGRGR